MKRVILFLIFGLTLLSFVFGAESTEERIWFYLDTGTNNIQKVNLTTPVISPAKYRAVWTSDGSDDPVAGTYVAKINVMGNIGCAYTDHQMVFTVSSDNRFVSQSDPSKYRTYYVVVKPKIRFKNTDYEYCCIDRVITTPGVIPEPANTPVSLDDYCPNTKNGQAIIYSPQLVVHHDGSADTYYYPSNTTGEKNKYVFSGSYDPNSYPNNKPDRFYCDLLMVLDPLVDEGTGEDQTLHLAEGSDYFATIYISADCNVEGCTKATHHMSYAYVIRGYYASSDSLAGRTFFTFVTPQAQATNLDVQSIINSQNAINSSFDFDNDTDVKALITPGAMISTIEIKTVPRGTDYKTKASVFITSSPTMSASNTSISEPFYLRHTDSDIRIPFKVVVKNLKNNTLQVFDGTANSGSTNKIDLSDNQTVVPDRQANKYNYVSYNGEVYIVFKDEAEGRITELVNGNTVVYPLVKISEFLDSEHIGMDGLYTSYIYYHIFLD